MATFKPRGTLYRNPVTYEVELILPGEEAVVEAQSDSEPEKPETVEEQEPEGSESETSEPEPGDSEGDSQEAAPKASRSRK